MIITRVPLRVSLFGGGTDLPEFYRQEAGQVLSFSINKYIYIASHPEFDGQYRMAYSKIENVDSIQKIQHPILRNTLDSLNIDFGIEIGSFADIPSKGSGLGSSSAFTVGLIDNLLRYKSVLQSQEMIAALAFQIERNLIGDPVGKQDHYGTAIGGLKHIIFHENENVTVNRINLMPSSSSVIEDNFKLVYTGVTRDAKSILKRNARNLESSLDFFARQKDLISLIPEGIIAIQNNDLEKLIELIDLSWKIKNHDNEAGNNQAISKLYLEMRDSGIEGIKLLGAGGGGFFFGIATPDVWSKFKLTYPNRKLIDLSLSLDGVWTYEI